jgi:Fe-S oxidoreductase
MRNNHISVSYTCIGLQLKCLLFLSHYNQNGNKVTYFTEFYEKPCGSPLFRVGRQKDQRRATDEQIRLFWVLLYESASNLW